MMNVNVREGKFDVVIVAGPRVEVWPSAGVRAISVLCAEMGLSVGQFGGDSMTVRGVIPLPDTGGIVLVEDIQKRIHRIRGRAIVRVTSEANLPNPFPGWNSQGLIPISTAERLLKESEILWHPITVVLGTGNRALRFASTLLKSGVPQVYVVETYAQWSAKRFAGWEVERRCFEILGGKLIEAKPLELTSKAPLIWQFRLQDSHGIRIMDVGRVVSAGPYRDENEVREHPPGSFLFEFEQTAAMLLEDDVEGWVLEEERGHWLAGKIVKTLVNDLGLRKDELDAIFRKARGRLKRYRRHREAPFTPSYEGKWMGTSDVKRIRTFRGVPQQEHKTRPIASIECFEEIPCNLCQTVCPTSAIQIGKVPRNKNTILNESACTACGLCLIACPTQSISLIHESEAQSMSRLTIPWQGAKPWKQGESATWVNRRGETLGSGRIIGIMEPKSTLPTRTIQPPTQQNKIQLVEVEVPTHLIWDARGLKRTRTPSSLDDPYLAAVQRSSLATEKVEITLNGEKRLVRDRVPISIALFEMGQTRPEDILFCKDGSCGLCQISVDGVKKAACQTRIHRGLNLRNQTTPEIDKGISFLCPCLKVTPETVIERLKRGKLQSPEAVLSVTHVGEGKCHGQLCMGALRRLLLEQGLDVADWIDWRFPWSDWILTHN